jgi:hypothetical protein
MEVEHAHSNAWNVAIVINFPKVSISHVNFSDTLRGTGKAGVKRGKANLSSIDG